MVLRLKVSRAGSILPLAVLAWIASPVGALSPPDAARLSRLQSACEAAWQVRVTTERSMVLAHRPTVDSDGLVIPRPPGRPALVTIGDPRSPERRIPWAQIQRVEAERSTLIRGTITGFLAGAVVGGVFLATGGPDLFEEGDNGTVGLAFVTTLGGAGIGMLVGMTHPDLRRLYP